MSLFEHPSVVKEIVRIKKICVGFEKVNVSCNAILKDKYAQINVLYPVKGHIKLCELLRKEGYETKRVKMGERYKTFALSSRMIDLKDV